jgi:hypothetical protein
MVFLPSSQPDVLHQWNMHAQKRSYFAISHVSYIYIYIYQALKRRTSIYLRPGQQGLLSLCLIATGSGLFGRMRVNKKEDCQIAHPSNRMTIANHTLRVSVSSCCTSPPDRLTQKPSLYLNEACDTCINSRRTE